MTRQTAKERRELIAAAEAAAAAEYQATLPNKILLAMGWAHKLDVSVHVLDNDSDEETPRWTAVFTFPERASRFSDLSCIGEEVTCGMDFAKHGDWAYQYLISVLQSHETFLESEKAGRAEAQAAWDTLTPSQRKALGVSQYRP